MQIQWRKGGVLKCVQPICDFPGSDEPAITPRCNFRQSLRFCRKLTVSSPCAAPTPRFFFLRILNQRGEKVMRSKHCAALGILFVVFAWSVMANILTTASATADCSGYSLTVSASDLSAGRDLAGPVCRKSRLFSGSLAVGPLGVLTATGLDQPTQAILDGHKRFG